MDVLLADDSKLIIDRLTDMISVFGQMKIVGSFSNGNDTLTALKTLKPDLAILDLKMPGLNGLEVISEIRKVNKTVKIIMLTFYSSDHYRSLAMKAGADYFFNKVDDFDEVSMVIAGILWKKGLESSLKN
jgi:DNA-binding NarL/FixJ family response regulator